MTHPAERKFREYLKNALEENAYIRKVPDKKITGSSSGLGLPDYLVITQGITTWYEVKKSSTKSTFNLNLISDSQWTEFNKLTRAGAKIYIAIYINNDLFIIPYKTLELVRMEEVTSVGLPFLDMWRA